MAIRLLEDNPDLHLNVAGDESRAVVGLWEPAEKTRRLHPGVGLVGPLRTLRGLDGLLRTLAANPQIQWLGISGRDISEGGRTEWALAQLWRRPDQIDQIRVTLGVQAGAWGDDLTPELVERVVRNVNLCTAAGYRGDRHLACMRIPGLELEPVWMPRAPLELDGRGPAGDPGQRVVGDTLSEVWRGVLAECLRFGVAVPTHYGATRDLHNLVSVIRDPEASLTEIIAGEVFDLFGWGWEDVKGYARRLSTGELPEGVSYSYGSRMVDGVGGEGVDQVAWMREQLAADPDYRGIYLTPWLPGADIGEGKGRPCLVGLLWRRQDGRLHLTATFRSHDLFEGYPQNAAGLACWLGDEAAAACLDVGTLTILSSSAHLYERDWSAAQRAAFSRASTMVDLDRRSCWRVYLDGGSLVAEGLTPDGDTVLARFAGPSVGNVAHRIHRSGLVSSISGALWLGGELERVWAGRLR